MAGLTMQRKVHVHNHHFALVLSLQRNSTETCDCGSAYMRLCACVPTCTNCGSAGSAGGRQEKVKAKFRCRVPGALRYS